MIYGVVLVIVIMFLPDGLIGFAKNLLRKGRANK
jgi:ABC-type branched-subunit amino acid transport system permease subunit